MATDFDKEDNQPKIIESEKFLLQKVITFTIIRWLRFMWSDCNIGNGLRLIWIRRLRFWGGEEGLGNEGVEWFTNYC